ncbi:MAG: hypothetical protein ACKV1O_05535 [Saprospiraceae bacterium]
MMNNHPKIPNDQWDLPIGYMSDGTPITLSGYQGFDISSKAEQFDEKNLKLEEKKQLVLNRIKSVENYGSFSFNNVRVDRETAINEVQADTPLGDYIIEIEMETINALIEILNQGSLNRE